MVFLHPDVKFYPGTESYRPALEKFSELLKAGELANLPEQKGDLGPIRKVKALKGRGDPVVKKHLLCCEILKFLPIIAGNTILCAKPYRALGVLINGIYPVIC